MTPQEAINTLNSIKQYYNDKNEDSYVGFDNEDNEALDMAIEALESQSCEDCISRSEALKHTHIEYDDDGVGHKVIYAEDIEELSPVTPKQKTGRWIRWYEIKKGDGYEEHLPHCKCSECEKEVSSYSAGFINYCPNCGAKMEVDE